MLRHEVFRFAALKLINELSISDSTKLTITQKLACLSQRIPIGFLSSQCVPSDMRNRFVETESGLVASHVRICLKIDRATESMTTVAASEPLLSEASFLLMQTQASTLLTR